LIDSEDQPVWHLLLLSQQIESCIVNSLGGEAEVLEQKLR
jgi:hypothetical protein